MMEEMGESYLYTNGRSPIFLYGKTARIFFSFDFMFLLSLILHILHIALTDNYFYCFFCCCFLYFLRTVFTFEMYDVVYEYFILPVDLDRNFRIE